MIIYEKTISIVEEYIDINNHVNNVVFLQLMQDVASEHTLSVGQTSTVYKKLNATWFAKKNTIIYNQQVLLHDTIIIKTWVDTIRKSSAIRKYEFINKKTNF